MRRWGPAVAAVLVAASLGTAGCAGTDPAAACPPVAGTATTALADDRGVLSAKVWLPVISSKAGSPDWLEPLDVASRSLTDAGLDGILEAKDADARATAVQAAVSDIPRAAARAVAGRRPGATPPGPSGTAEARSYHLLVPASPLGDAVGAYYAAALERQGHAVSTTAAGTAEAVTTVSRDRAGDVALVELPDLAGTLGALLPSTGTSGQVRAAATVAAERSLVLGAPSAANRTPQVVVTRAFAAAHGNLTDLTGLARACPGLPLTATDGAVGALAPLSAAYGLGTAGADRDAVGGLRSGRVAAALAPVRHHAG